MIKEMVQETIDKFFKNLEEARREESDRRVLETLEELYNDGEIEKRVRPDGEIIWGPSTEKGKAQWKKQIAEGLIERRVSPDGEIVWRLTKKGIALSKKGKL